jgi:hypothetical protein
MIVLIYKKYGKCSGGLKGLIDQLPAAAVRDLISK